MTNTHEMPANVTGSVFEYDGRGKRQAGMDVDSINGMLSTSKVWPKTYHQWVGADGRQAWAKNGRRIDAPSF